MDLVHHVGVELWALQR